MKRHPFCANRSNFADSTFPNAPANAHQCICSFKQAIDTECKPESRQGLLVKHVQELAKTSSEFVGSKRFTLVGGGLVTID